jgi:geranylgeranyl pyrophosphate synthase
VGAKREAGARVGGLFQIVKDFLDVFVLFKPVDKF